MKQINFRLSDQEYKNFEEMAKILKKSVPSLIKEISLNELNKLNRDLSLELYKKGQIGFKKAWLLSGLDFMEFINLLVENKIEPNIPDDLDNKMIESALNTSIEDIFPQDKIEFLRKKYN